MNNSILKNLGPGTQLLFLILIAFFTLFLMQITAFLVIRPLWGVNIFESIDEISKLETSESVHITKVIQVFYQIGMFLLPALVFKKLFGDSDKPFFILQKNIASSFWIQVAVFFLVAFPLINFLHYLNMQIPFSNDLISEDEESKNMLMKLLGGDSFGFLLVNIFVYAVVPAVVEEYFFRGIILRQIALASKNVHVAVFVSAALFSFIHGEATVFIPRFLMGAALGYMLVWSGNLMVCMLAHFVNNLLSIILIHLVLTDKLDAKYDMLGANEGDIPVAGISIALTAVILYFMYQKRNAVYSDFVSEEITKQKQTNTEE
jgi:membrane protease YdiL (CAAX protease family)